MHEILRGIGGRAYRKIRSRYPRYVRLVEKEIASWETLHLPLPARVGMWRRGFLSEARVIYDFERHLPGAYLSDYARFVRTRLINRSHENLLDDKRRFGETLAALGHDTVVPESYAAIERGVARRLKDDVTMPLAVFLREQLSASPRLVIKPLEGACGEGILRIEACGTGVLLNGEILADEDQVAARVSPGKHLAVEFVQQAAYAETIFQGSTNTIRILTMPDVTSGGDMFIASAVHRFGTSATVPVDNWSRGGLSALVNIESGELGAGVTYPRNGRLEWHTHHPDTGALIAGVRVPRWEEVAAGTLAVARALRDLVPYVGWDIVVTGTGFRMLEGNKFSDVNLLQVHRPLLQDPRVRAFYRAQRVI